eukprot:CAMPEP_0172625926 /NCGR_PEP_ID=MMETSP1068-20121228/146813_1 /TAXON_ID=35684 /ORGANISM="Pseudopedinella elastica, Strain CCMP716" /LENGTH=55 /DNA_ID=CAMNT_0013435369 /DNA_START=250 /DNA_END=418 /DNA_ORIENTATION=-
MAGIGGKPATEVKGRALIRAGDARDARESRDAGGPSHLSRGSSAAPPQKSQKSRP